MAIRLQQAGFNIGFTPIYWTYASGFPKAMNIGKAVDKRLGVEREVVGINKDVLARNPQSNHAQDYGGYADGEIAARITKPTSQEAKALDGTYGGFQPKPAVEVIIVAMKPLSKRTYVDQALKNGKGVTWLGDTRIPIDESVDDSRLGGKGSWTTSKPQTIYGGGNGIPRGTVASSPQGRFPANLLVSDDTLNDGRIHTSGQMDSIAKHDPATQNCYGKMTKVRAVNAASSGSFSRFFDLDRWWERKLSELPENVQRTFPFLICPKASKSERNRGLESLPTKLKPSHMRTANGTGVRSVETGFPDTFVKNTHPTVKPIKLMAYLVALGSRADDLVLDPFVGSGTTCVAAKILGRRYVGIELNPEYCRVAEARLAAFDQSHLDKFLLQTS